MEISVFVYFIATSSGPVKIGISHDPHGRMSGFQTGHYEYLYLLSTIECSSFEDARCIEKAFHSWYSERKMLNEWYDLDPRKVQSDVKLLMHLSTMAIEYQEHTSASRIGMPPTAVKIPDARYDFLRQYARRFDAGERTD